MDTYYKGKKILICGGAGFIGSHMVDAFVRLNADVTVVDPCFPAAGGHESYLAGSASHVKWVKEPIQEFTSLDAVLSCSDVVIDAMGFTRHHEGMENPGLDFELNYLPHLTLIQALNRFPKPAIYLGSRGQYGKLQGSVNEDYPQIPNDPQGIHKSAAESMFRIYSKKFNWPCLSFRIGNCFGPRQPLSGRDVGLISGFIRSILLDEVVEIYGEEGRCRNLIYIDDLVDIMMMVIPQVATGFKSLNIMGEPIVLKSVLDHLISQTGTGNYVFMPFPEEIAALDPGQAVISNEEMCQYINDYQYSSLEHALNETINYSKMVLKNDMAL